MLAKATPPQTATLDPVRFRRLGWAARHDLAQRRRRLVAELERDHRARYPHTAAHAQNALNVGGCTFAAVMAAPEGGE